MSELRVQLHLSRTPASKVRFLPFPLATWKATTFVTMPRSRNSSATIASCFVTPLLKARSLQKPIPMDLLNIAGICSAGRNVLGMMPHPERASESELGGVRSEEHTSELQSRLHLVCRLLLEKK